MRLIDIIKQAQNIIFQTMLQFNLIESIEYYKRRQRIWALQLLVLPLPVAILVNAHHYPLYVSFIAGAFLLAGVWITARNIRRYKLLSNKRLLQLGEDTIHISANGSANPLTIQTAAVEEVTLPDLQELPGETVSGLFDEMRGKNNRYFILIKIQGQQYRFDFVMDSHYHLNQLEQLVLYWVGQGIKVSRVKD